MQPPAPALVAGSAATAAGGAAGGARPVAGENGWNHGAELAQGRAYATPDAILRPTPPLPDAPVPFAAGAPLEDAPDEDAPAEAFTACPPATTDIAFNLVQRQVAIDVARYGPLDPTQDNNLYWEEAATAWRMDVEAVKQARCVNCAAFNITTSMMDCIVDGFGGAEARNVARVGGMGFCELFDFTCNGARRCDAWIAGGPITDGLQQSLLDDASAEEDLQGDEGKAATADIVVPAWMRSNAKQGLEWHADGKSGDGVTDKTLREARAMAAGSVSANKAMRMAAWFARHMSDLDAPDAQVGAKNYPSAGVVAHALWGGGTRTESKRAARWAANKRDMTTSVKLQSRVPAGSRAGGQFGEGGGGGGAGASGDEQSSQDKTVTGWTSDSRDLTASEGDAVEGYALFSMQLNADLRNGNKLSATDKENIESLDSAVNSSSAGKDTLLYRSMPASAVADVKVGEIITDKAYLSTSKRHDVARDLLGITGGTDVVVQIHARKGTRGVDVNRALGKRSEYADQHEVLLPRGTQLRVTKMYDNGRFKTVYAEVVAP